MVTKTDREEKTMLSDQILKKNLEEIKEITQTDIVLFAENGRVSAGTCPAKDSLSECAGRFIQSSAEAMTADGCQFFRILIEQTQEVYTLAVCAGTQEAYMIGRLAACQIRSLLEFDAQSSGREAFFREVLYGNIPLEEIYERARRLEIPSKSRIVYVMRTDAKRDPACVETVRNLFSDREEDILLETDERTMILIKEMEEEEKSAQKTAQMILDNVQAEAMQQLTVACGRQADDIGQLSRSCQEAEAALEIGRAFYSQSRILDYDSLGIGRLVYEMPGELGQKFVDEIFRGREGALDEESLETIRRFFDNDLNISETARQMYIHRNTLVYRLERIEKAMGLDVRRFEDAMKLKIALMIRQLTAIENPR